MGDSAGVPPEPVSFGQPRSRLFTVEEARALMPEVHAYATELIEVRADLTELAADLRMNGESDRGVKADLKALEARFSELQGWFTNAGIEVKGLAPLLLDFPALLEGVSVRLCWLEGEPELAWYHRTDLGFMARRPLHAPTQE